MVVLSLMLPRCTMLCSDKDKQNDSLREKYLLLIIIIKTIRTENVENIQGPPWVTKYISQNFSQGELFSPF